MRIRELKLIRYGKFTDRSLALPFKDRDIHLIVGPTRPASEPYVQPSGIGSLAFRCAHPWPFCTRCPSCASVA